MNDRNMETTEWIPYARYGSGVLHCEILCQGGLCTCIGRRPMDSPRALPYCELMEAKL